MTALAKTYSLDFRQLINTARFDWIALGSALALISIGLVMISSASIDFASLKYNDPWFFTKRHIFFLGFSTCVAVCVMCIPSHLWDRFSIVFLMIGIVLLVAVLIPGVGKVVNGSRRWILLGPMSLQASELAKFCFIIFFASFLSRHVQAFQQGWFAFFKLIFILLLFVVLLLLEPDFGSSVVLCVTAGVMMFMVGIPMIRFLLLIILGISALAFLAVTSPYRWERLVTFLDPWSQQFSSGYQLVQSLIAFGRGEWFGLGLGNSLQKLFFLPEAHTDFIFSIIAEEFGLIGALVVMGLFITLVYRIFCIAFNAYQKQQLFSCFCAVGFATLLATQAFINMGVASGLLPTKGLTLPFISAGGSSLLVSFSLLALVLRMDWELKQ